MSACRHGLTPSYIADSKTWYTYGVGMSACFYNNPKFFTRKYQMNYSVAVGMSACRHIFLPSPPAPTRCPHAWFTYLRDSVIRCFGLFWSQPRYILGFQMQYRILSACRHVGMSAWFDPPPILPTTKHDIHIVSACRHVFITAPNFLFENTKWAIVSLSACRHVGIYPPPPTLQHRILSTCRHVSMV